MVHRKRILEEFERYRKWNRKNVSERLRATMQGHIDHQVVGLFENNEFQFIYGKDIFPLRREMESLLTSSIGSIRLNVSGGIETKYTEHP